MQGHDEMNEKKEIDIFKVLDYMRDHAPLYAKAKADRIYLEEMKKAKKAVLMKEAEMRGFSTAAAQEREAYADAQYMELIEGLKVAVEQEETLKWRLVAAEVKTQVWRSIESSNRALDRGAQ